MKKRVLTFFLLITGFLSGCALPKDGAPTFEDLLEQSRLYSLDQEYERAMESALSALSIAEGEHEAGREAEALCTAAVVDLMMMRDNQAWEKACRAEDLSRGRDKEQLSLCKALIVKGRVCSYASLSAESNRDDEAITYLEKARSLASENSFLEQLAEACYHLSEVYVNKNRWTDPPVPALYARAGEYLREGELAAEIGMLPEMTRRAIPFRIRYLRQGGDLAGAASYCESLLDGTPRTDWLTRQQLYDQLTVLYAERGMTAESLESHQQYVHAMQQYIRQKENAKLQDLENRYEQLKERRKTERWYLTALSLTALLLTALAFMIVILRKNRLLVLRSEELAAADREKEQVLSYISNRFGDPAAGKGKTVEELISPAEGMAEDVSRYVENLASSRREAAAQIGLTARETEILHFFSQGLTAGQVAERLYLSPRTVNNHKQKIFEKMEVNNNAEMVFKARQLGLI